MSIGSLFLSSWADPWATKPPGKRPDEINWSKQHATATEMPAKPKPNDGLPKTKVCDHCKKVYDRYPNAERKRYVSRKAWIASRFCSRKCQSDGQGVHIGRANFAPKRRMKS